MATQTHLETLTLSRSSGVTFAECGRRVNMMRCTSLLSDITCIACRRHGLQRLADNDLPRPVVKRKGGRRHADRCEGCGFQAARGKACGRCSQVDLLAKRFAAQISLR